MLTLKAAPHTGFVPLPATWWYAQQNLPGRRNREWVALVLCFKAEIKSWSNNTEILMAFTSTSAAQYNSWPDRYQNLGLNNHAIHEAVSTQWWKSKLRVTLCKEQDPQCFTSGPFSKHSQKISKKILTCRTYFWVVFRGANCLKNELLNGSTTTSSIT